MFKKLSLEIELIQKSMRMLRIVISMHLIIITLRILQYLIVVTLNSKFEVKYISEELRTSPNVYGHKIYSLVNDFYYIKV